MTQAFDIEIHLFQRFMLILEVLKLETKVIKKLIVLLQMEVGLKVDILDTLLGFHFCFLIKVFVSFKQLINQPIHFGME